MSDRDNGELTLLTVRLELLESEVYYLKNHPKDVEWRCPETISVDSLRMAYRCEVSSCHRDADEYNTVDGIVHDYHRTYLNLKSGQRVKIEWKNHG